MAFPKAAGQDRSGMGERGEIPPFKEAQQTHDGAPAGPTFGADNPSVAVPGGMPMTTGGYSPQPGNPPLPRNPMDGAGKAPTGNRR